MSIIQQIDTELKEAMKSKSEFELATLRLVKTALKNKQIELMHELSDEDAQAVIKSMVKQGKDALVDFTGAGRQDLMERQAKELAFLEKFLPAAMSETELEEICKKAIAEVGATSAADMGKAMGAAMKLAAGKADGNAVKSIVQKLLSSQSQ